MKLLTWATMMIAFGTTVNAGEMEDLAANTGQSIWNITGRIQDLRAEKNVFAFVPVPTQQESSWLRQTSMIDNKDCPPAPRLYRGLSGYFSLARAVQNMLGDELAEHTSWRFSKQVKARYGSNPTIAQWREMKALSANELQEHAKSYKEICDFAREASGETLRDGDEKDSYGIPTTPDYQLGASYATKTLIRIDERFPRAAKERAMTNIGSAEYYIPIVIPAQDISGAWESGFFAEKNVTNDGALLNVKLYRSKTSDWLGIPYEPKEPEPGGLVGVIVLCSQSEPCISDRPKTNGQKEEGTIDSIMKTLDNMQTRGFRYRLKQDI